VGHSCVRQAVALAASAGLLASGGTSDSGSNGSSQFTANTPANSDAIATDADYPNAIVLTSSQIRLCIPVRDAQLAPADEATRQNAAATLVAVAEQVLTLHPEFLRLEAGSVAIIHRGAAGVTASDWHYEDVAEFRNGPEQRSLCLSPDEARRRPQRFCAIQCHCGTRLNEQ
jgi:hypothetical protein